MRQLIDIGPLIHSIIYPLRKQIEPILRSGNLAVVISDVTPGSITASVAESFGWTGGTLVVEVPPEGCQMLYDEWVANDRIAANWVVDSSKLRIYLLTNDANFCLNMTPEGIRIESGTTDGERDAGN